MSGTRKKRLRTIKGYLCPHCGASTFKQETYFLEVGSIRYALRYGEFATRRKGWVSESGLSVNTERDFVSRNPPLYLCHKCQQTFTRPKYILLPTVPPGDQIDYDDSPDEEEDD